MINQIITKLRNSFQKRNLSSFHDYPFGRQIRSNKLTYLEIWKKAKNQYYPVVDQFEKETGFSLDLHWFHELALHTQVVIKDSEICYQHGRLLYTFLSNYVQKINIGSLNILETGTARGFSSLCMAKALQDSAKEGKIITLDPLPHHVKMYWNHFQSR